MSILQTLIDDVKNALDKLRAHLADLGHETADDATALVAQAQTAAGPVVQTAETDAKTVAVEAEADVADVATSFATGGIVPAPATDPAPAAS